MADGVQSGSISLVDRGGANPDQLRITPEVPGGQYRKPKKAIAGFMFFASSQREIIKRTNPEMAFTDIVKVLGEKWRDMSAEEKASFHAKAREDKKRYQDEMVFITRTHSRLT